MSDKFNRYHKIAKIGSGGMGDVFRVIDLDLERECAMKCVPLQQSTENGVESVSPSGRLNREVAIMAGMHDPNVVHIYDHFQHDNQLCIVMELCQISVADWVNQREPFSLLTALEMGMQILSALSAIHEKGIVHRDIKPHNILVSLSGKAFKLTDFGLASLRDASMVLTQSGVFAGTVAFMSPEQRLSFKDVTPATDLYSLAMTMQWVLFGELRGDLFSKRTLFILQQEIECREWPMTLLSFFEKAGAEVLAERFQTAEEMQGALGDIVKSIDAAQYTRLTPHDFQSVHRYESQLSSRSKPVPEDNLLSTEELQAQTNRWIKRASAILLVMLLIVVGLSIQILRLDPDNTVKANGSTELVASIPACTETIETQHQFRTLGPRETQGAAMIDVDGDGFIDATYTNQMDKTVSVYWGNSEYAFGELMEMEIGRSHHPPLIGDINHDGMLDMVTLHNDESRIRSYIQVEPRTWKLYSDDFQGPPPKNGTLVDLNRDGWLDVMFTAFEADQNIQYRLGSAEGFGPHTPLGRVPKPVFIPGQPWLVYSDGQRIWRRDILSNVSMSAPVEISRVSDIKRVFPVQIQENEWVLYGVQSSTKKLIELSAEPCWKMELNDKEYAHMRGLGDWNNDGVIDWIGFMTCAGCTSNHLLQLNGTPSLSP